MRKTLIFSILVFCMVGFLSVNVFAQDIEAKTATSDNTSGFSILNSSSTGLLRVRSNGNVGIGSDNPAYKLEVGGMIWSNGGVFVQKTGDNHFQLANAAMTWYVSNEDDTNRFVINNGGGAGVYLENGGSSWVGFSDIRLKENIQPVENALAKLMQLRAVSYNFKSNSPDQREIGVIAQEVQEQFPELVSENGEGYLGVSYDRLGPILIEAVKELNAKVETLEAENARLAVDNEALKAEVAKVNQLESELKTIKLMLESKDTEVQKASLSY